MRIKSMWKAGVFNLVFQFLLLISMFLLGLDTRIQADSAVRFLILTVLVFVSTLVWVGFFYLQDRREPEPIPHILVSFASGMAIWALLGYPLIHILFKTDEWIHASTMLFILGSFFVLGTVFSLLLFGFLRFIFMPMKEFDEPVDGMVYGAVIGAGYAALKSFYTLWSFPDYTLFAMTYIISTQVLIYSGVGALMGYLTGQTKFQKRNIQLFSILGVSVGLVLLGTYHILNEFLFLSGFTHAFWISFGLTGFYTLTIFSACIIRMRHLTKGKPTKPKHSHFLVRPVMIVYGLVLLAAAGVISDYGSQGEKYFNASHGIGFVFPHTLSFVPFQGLKQDIHLESMNSEILFNRENTVFPDFHFSLEVRRKNSSPEFSDLAALIPVTETENLLVENTVIDHWPGNRISYSYLNKSGTNPTEFPILFKVIADIIPVQKNIFIFTFRASDCHFNAARKKYDKIISSVKWNTKR